MLCLQAFSHPISSSTQHPVERLAWEVQQLRDKLALASSTTNTVPAKTQEPRRTDSNLNQNTNNSTFLFPACRTPGPVVSRTMPPILNLQPRVPPASSSPLSRPGQRDSSKHTFLFGHPSSSEARPDQRYFPAPNNNAKLPKSNGPSLGS